MLPFMNNQNVVRDIMIAGPPLSDGKRLVAVILFWLSVSFLAFGAFQLFSLTEAERTVTALFLVFLVLISVWLIWLGISLLRAKASQS